MKGILLFMAGFLKDSKKVGAVMPSSRFLTKKITSKIDFKNSRRIVELGPGLGTFTRAILEKSHEDAKLLAFEVNKDFCRHLRKNIYDERLFIINAGAEKISDELEELDMLKVDCIVSGLPFLNFPNAKIKKIVSEIKNSLKDDGRLILFQYTTKMDGVLKSSFGKVQRSFTPMNVPPAFVYTCEK